MPDLGKRNFLGEEGPDAARSGALILSVYVVFVLFY